MQLQIWFWSQKPKEERKKEGFFLMVFSSSKSREGKSKNSFVLRWRQLAAAEAGVGGLQCLVEQLWSPLKSHNYCRHNSPFFSSPTQVFVVVCVSFSSDPAVYEPCGFFKTIYCIAWILVKDVNKLEKKISEHRRVVSFATLLKCMKKPYWLQTFQWKTKRGDPPLIIDFDIDSSDNWIVVCSC